MKKWLLMLAAGALFTGCSDDDNVTPTPEPPTPTPENTVTLSLSVSEIETDSANVSVTPSDASAAWFADVYVASEVSGVDDATLVSNARAQSDFSDKLHTGTLVLPCSGLIETTDYTVVAFAWDAANSVAGKVAKTSFTTETPSNPTENTVTLKLDVSGITADAAKVSVTPSNEASSYFAYLYAASEVKNLDDETLVSNALAQSDFSSSLYSGTRVLPYAGLAESTEYTVVAFAWNAEYELAGKVAKTSFTTETTVVVEPFKVEISVTDVSAEGATVTFIPNNEDTRYLGRLFTTAELADMRVASDQEIIEYILENPYSEQYVYTGMKTVVRDNLLPATEYLALAFDYMNGGTVFRYTFNTLSGSTESDIKVTSITPSYTSCTVHCVPGDNTKPYYYVVMEPEWYESYGGGAMTRAYYMLHNKAIMKYDDMSAYLKVVAHYGEGDLVLSDSPYAGKLTLTPGTSYVAMIFYVDLTQTDPTTVYDWRYEEVRFTTLEANDDVELGAEIAEPAVTWTSGKSIYDLSVNVKTSGAVKTMRYSINYWNNNIASYWDENDFSQIAAFFFLKSASSDMIEAAASAGGTNLNWYNWSVSDGTDLVVLVEVMNEEGKTVYSAKRFNLTDY